MIAEEIISVAKQKSFLLLNFPIIFQTAAWYKNTQEGFMEGTTVVALPSIRGLVHGIVQQVYKSHFLHYKECE